MKKMMFAIAALGLLSSAQAIGDRSRVYKSPDRTLQAVVVTDVAGESRIEIQAITGRVLFKQDKRSENGAHGYGIVHAAWTADSRFFVASTEASGGHQPWARPLWAYSRSKNRVFNLGRLGVATTDFTLKAPDIVQTTVVGCDAEARTFVLSLRRLVLTGREPTAPCPNL